MFTIDNSISVVCIAIYINRECATWSVQFSKLHHTKHVCIAFTNKQFPHKCSDTRHTFSFTIRYREHNSHKWRNKSFSTLTVQRPHMHLGARIGKRCMCCLCHYCLSVVCNVGQTAIQYQHQSLFTLRQCSSTHAIGMCTCARGVSTEHNDVHARVCTRVHFGARVHTRSY